MTQQFGEDPPGSTPLDGDDLQDLRLPWVATRNDLNIAELENIAKAYSWARMASRRIGPSGVLSTSFLYRLHKRTFGDVWRWAGQQRSRQTNLGVAANEITTSLKLALDDALYWHEKNVFPIDERAVRIHHRLVVVHPFRNGNGRCTRLIADMYLVSIGEIPFSWGIAADLNEATAERTAYLGALRAADTNDYENLVAFARR